MLSTQKKNVILKYTPDWMDGKLTVYKVAILAHVKWQTANTYLNKFAPVIKAQEIKIVDKLTKIDEFEDKSTIWERIKKKIWSSILTEQSTMQTPK